MRVFMTGATGLIGSRIVEGLRDRGDEVVVLTRELGPARSKLGDAVEYVEGKPQVAGSWEDSVDGCDAVINLAGAPIFGTRWSNLYKVEMRNSRILSTWNVVQAIGQAAKKPAVLVNTSAIGYYGNVPDGDLDESSPAGQDFLAKLTVDWENAAEPVQEFGTRLSLIRVGVVLAAKGGALEPMLGPFRMGVGGPVGSGRQWMSWIHLDDLARIYLRALDDHLLHGPINGTAPVPVSNLQFSRDLAAVLHRPCVLPIPVLALRMMFGEVADVIAGGQRVLPRKLRRTNFEFEHPTCREALESILSPREKPAEKAKAS